MVNETLYQIRRHLARFWLTMPPQSLETAYRSELGNVYKVLLNSGIQRQELSSEDEALKQQLTQVGVGLSQPNSLNALMGAMLFYPANQMKVRDAKTRLPAWMYDDYAAVFETETPADGVEQTVSPIASPAPTVSTAESARPAPSPAPAPSEPEALPELPPVHQQHPTSIEFTNRAIGCANLYYIDPSDQEIVVELRQIRHHLARHLVTIAPPQLEAVYTTNVGDAYRALLKSQFRAEPLSQEEASIKQQLTQASAGLTRPDSINALMAVMLYAASGQLKVRDARNRLPGWLYDDYINAFETGETASTVAPTVASTATQTVASTVASTTASTPTTAAPSTPTPVIAPAPSLPAPATQTYMPELAVNSPTFLNRLLGSVNLYKIDPSDRDICREMSQLRRRFADHWLTLEESSLEAVYQSDLGRGFKLLLASGFQGEPLDSEEETYKQALTQVAVGLSAPKALNAMMVAMLYFPTDKLRVQAAAQRLPAWLLPDYLSVFEGKQAAPDVLDVQPPSPAFIDRLTATVNRYQVNPNDAGAIAELRRLRHALANYWINLDPAQLPATYAGALGNAHRVVVGSGFAKTEKTPLDRETFKQLSAVLSQGMQHPKAMNYFAAAMLYCTPEKLQVGNAADLLPVWLLADYNRFFARAVA